MLFTFFKKILNCVNGPSPNKNSYLLVHLDAVQKNYKEQIEFIELGEKEEIIIQFKYLESLDTHKFNQIIFDLCPPNLNLAMLANYRIKINNIEKIRDRLDFKRINNIARFTFLEDSVCDDILDAKNTSLNRSGPLL